MSKFKVEDEFNHPYYGKVKILCHVEGTYYCKDGKGNNIQITESEMPSIPFQTVYAICDEKGDVFITGDNEEDAKVNYIMIYCEEVPTNYSIRPYALTPINE